jgi:hypothetical protein
MDYKSFKMASYFSNLWNQSHRGQIYCHFETFGRKGGKGGGMNLNIEIGREIMAKCMATNVVIVTRPDCMYQNFVNEHLLLKQLNFTCMAQSKNNNIH